MQEKHSLAGPPPAGATEGAVNLEFEAWLTRLEQTYESVANCCFHRLDHDRALAERASLHVIAGLLWRPAVFQYFGLPFSGRVAHLAEQRIEDAKRGTLPGDVAGWDELCAYLRRLSSEQQRLFVLTCVEGHDSVELASALECAEDVAKRQREAAIEVLRDIVRRCDLRSEVRRRPDPNLTEKGET